LDAGGGDVDEDRVVGVDTELGGHLGQRARTARAGDDCVEELRHAGQLERRSGPFAARRQADLLPRPAQFADPGDRAGQRPYVAVAEVGDDGLQG
jgi:hypothetical protein